jgi:copper chaperone CopZ
MAALSLHCTTLRVAATSGVDCRRFQANRASAAASASCSSLFTSSSSSSSSSCSVSSLGSRFSTVRYGWGNNGRRVVRAVIEEAVASEQVDVQAPTDNLSMYFKAEGSLIETAIPKVTKALEATEGVSNVNVYISEGAATVELTKQTSIQATGVASGLVEIIEQAGFKMQALSLGFDEDDEDDNDYIDYDTSTYVDEDEVAAEA